MVSTRRSAAVSAASPSPPMSAKKKSRKREKEKDQRSSPVKPSDELEKEGSAVTPPVSPDHSTPQADDVIIEEELKEEETSVSVKEMAMSEENSSEFEYEFGGPLGALSVMVGLPGVIYGLYFFCNSQYLLTVDKISAGGWSAEWNSLEATLPGVQGLSSDEGWGAVLGWLFFHVLLERVLPGELAFGCPLPRPPAGTTAASSVLEGEQRPRLAYTMSGHLQFWVTLGVLLFGAVDWAYDPSAATLALSSFRPLPLEFIYDQFLPLLTASTVVSLLLSFFVYLHSFLPGALLAEGGVSGNVLYDFFIGRELNPRVGSLDLKEFCELRPGLVGWAVINLGMAFKQHQRNGAVSMSMLLINLFQGFYVWDALHSEKSILSTMDITTDGFGFMLVFGDLTWVPFVYSLQARYLVDYDPHLTLPVIGAIVLLQCAGYYIFRAANSQKDTFRRDPQDSRVVHLTFLETKRGTRLITSGWWGLARKINYTGEWEYMQFSALRSFSCLSIFCNAAVLCLY